MMALNKTEEISINISKYNQFHSQQRQVTTYQNKALDELVR